MVSAQDIESLCQGRHPDPFAVLGCHAGKDALRAVRCFLPGARSVTVTDQRAKPLAALTQRDARGFFEGLVPLAADQKYRLRVQWSSSATSDIDDPYCHGLLLSEHDIWLLAEGTHLRPFEVLGAHPLKHDGVEGTRFAVWAPNAQRVSVVGDFNFWDSRLHPMRLRRECGVWELFVPGIGPGVAYKFDLLGPAGQSMAQRTDPYAHRAELRPATASIVSTLPEPVSVDPQRGPANARGAPIAIYEVHLGSWRRITEEGNRWLTWDELADSLVPYAQDMGFTHLELLPVSEHPFDGSWGYQPIGLYAPTARFGDPEAFSRFVRRCHSSGIGLILDWVPAHFPSDAHGLSQFDGTHLYEYADPREGFHQDWNTLIYNLKRTEVANFLLGNAVYWLERFGVDGLRVDAVASMLYRDYSRQPGQWIPNVQGGRENLEAIGFFKRLNEVIGSKLPHAITVAEESTAFPGVSHPTSTGGLGFHYKWNMGWMNDTLAYMARDPVHRKHHQNELSFSLVYAFHENFVLPISHDEVVHGKGSLLTKMPGDRWQQFANVRALLGYMYGHPGKKLLFMGCEFAQEREWNHEQSLDWHLLRNSDHAGIQNLVRDLNQLYRSEPALHERDCTADGFEWISNDDAQHSVLAFLRKAGTGASPVLVVCNFTPEVRPQYRVGVPRPGRYEELLSTDHKRYAGSGVCNPAQGIDSEALPWQGRAQSLVLTLAPLAVHFLVLRS